jgi:hypothetical protein
MDNLPFDGPIPMGVKAFDKAMTGIGLTTGKVAVTTYSSDCSSRRDGCDVAGRRRDLSIGGTQQQPCCQLARRVKEGIGLAQPAGLAPRHHLRGRPMGALREDGVAQRHRRGWEVPSWATGSLVIAFPRRG